MVVVVVVVVIVVVSFQATVISGQNRIDQVTSHVCFAVQGTHRFVFKEDCEGMKLNETGKQELQM